MISGELEVNWFAQIILKKRKFDIYPLRELLPLLSWTYDDNWLQNRLKFQLIRMTVLNLDEICWNIVMRCAIWYHLCNLKNLKKHPWRSVTFSSKVAGQKRGCFSHFLSCTNDAKSRKTSAVESFYRKDVILKWKGFAWYVFMGVLEVFFRTHLTAWWE